MWPLLGLLISLIIMVVGLALETVAWFLMAMWRVSRESFDFKKFLDFQGLFLAMILILFAEDMAFGSLTPLGYTHTPNNVVLGSLSYIGGAIGLFWVSKEYLKIESEIEENKVIFLGWKRMKLSIAGLIISTLGLFGYLFFWLLR